MSQTGNIVSVAQYVGAGVGGSWNGISDGGSWIVQFAYQLDAGGTAQAQVVVGSGAHATVGLWASPTSTISIASAPGTTNLPIVLPCPPLIKAATFGLPLN